MREVKVEPFRAGDKRFAIKAGFNWRCDGCGLDRFRDLESDPGRLAYPMINRPFKVTLYCEDCGHESERAMEIRMSVAVEI